VWGQEGVEEPVTSEEALEAGPIHNGPCWLEGATWEASLGLGVLLAFGGLASGLAGRWEATSIIATGAIVVLVLLWDRPLARFPLVLLLAGIDAGALLASRASKIVAPPFFMESDRFGSSLALDPAALAVIADLLARVRACRQRVKGLKPPGGGEPLMVPR
jgi:hypothetical protein